VFLRRLRNPGNVGVSALMRYTLRLLTAQQFQRAGTLMCAMEYLRTHPDVRTPSAITANLGEARFSVGIFLGSSTTPNRREEALNDLKRLKTKNGKNRFVVRKCPWCGAEMGFINVTEDGHRKTGRRFVAGSDKREAVGYRLVGNTLRFRCADTACAFGPHNPDGLPLYVVDEDIYEAKPELRPTLVIATVDKFATLAWNPRGRYIFGIDHTGKRDVSPPGLIIQDELHLISGPLGTMVGLLEPVIEALCTDNQGAKPKIVCSTATIRAYEEQILKLYGRATPEGKGNAALFPPPGLDASDSFFARYARNKDGSLQWGRKYVGVSGSGFTSIHAGSPTAHREAETCKAHRG